MSAIIIARAAVTSQGSVQRRAFPESVLAKVRRLPAVQDAIGGVADDNTDLIGKNGKVIDFAGGAPHLGFSIDPSRRNANGLVLAEGVWPNDGEVVIDRWTADKKQIAVGDAIKVKTKNGVREFRVSGLFSLGRSNVSLGGATVAGFDLHTAQKLFRKEGKLDEIRISAKPGGSRANLLRQIWDILPPQTQVRISPG
jgi:putative ABC transport system permease protein